VSAARIQRRSGVPAACAFVVALIALSAVPPPALAGSCAVEDAETGQTYTSLQAAVNSAKAGDTLMIAGTCAGETTLDRDLALEGVVAATGKPTLLGMVSVREGLTISLTHLKLVSGISALEGGVVNIAGCTLTGNFYGGESSSGRGLFLHMASSRLVKAGIGMTGAASIAESVITASSGDGISILGPVEVADSTISKNARLGIAAHGGDIALTNSKVTGNKEGGIRDDRATVYLSDSTVAGNTGAEQGGGIFAVQATVRLAGSSSVSENSTSGEGGGIWASEFSDVVLEGAASVARNTASAPGGGIYASEHSFVTMTDKASIKNNLTASSGAGIYVGPGYTEEEPTKATLGGSSLIAGNKAAGAGGGVYLRGAGSILELVGSSSIKSNEAATSGGGVYAGRTESGSSEIVHGTEWKGVISGNLPDNVFTA
jgi:parallel beta helix pectate lyase-like protein